MPQPGSHIWQRNISWQSRPIRASALMPNSRSAAALTPVMTWLASYRINASESWSKTLLRIFAFCQSTLSFGIIPEKPLYDRL